jgi:hypothetical protein
MVTACKHISVGLVQGKENKTLLLWRNVIAIIFNRLQVLKF